MFLVSPHHDHNRLSERMGSLLNPSLRNSQNFWYKPPEDTACIFSSYTIMSDLKTKEKFNNYFSYCSSSKDVKLIECLMTAEPDYLTKRNVLQVNVNLELAIYIKYSRLNIV